MPFELADSPHLIVEALAGTGKTFTLKAGVNALHWRPLAKGITLTDEQDAIVKEIAASGKPGKCHMTSFSTDAAEQLASGLPDGVTDSSTFGLGLRTAKSIGWATRIDRGDWKYGAILNNFVRDCPDAEHRWPGFRIDILDMCKKARLELIRTIDEEQLIKLADHYGVTIPYSRLSYNSPTRGIDLFIEALNFMLYHGRQEVDQFDYTDMLYIPLIHRIVGKQFDHLFVDEYQDMGRAQQELCFRVARKLFPIGDANQAIYGFIGADANAIDSFKRVLGGTFRGVKTLPLTFTRRCPKAVVAEANRVLETGLKALPEAPDGIVRKITCDQFSPDKSLTPRDMMICPTNAPLVGLLFRLTDKGIKAFIRKSDIVDKMCKYCDRYNEKGIEELRKAIDGMLEQATGDSRKARIQRDQYGCLKKIAEKSRTPEECVFAINGMFSEQDRPGAIRLSTVHRAKGLEADRIIFWEHDRCGAYAKLKWEMKQAKNLEYVGITRARQELILCRS